MQVDSEVETYSKFHTNLKTFLKELDMSIRYEGNGWYGQFEFIGNDKPGIYLYLFSSSQEKAQVALNLICRSYNLFYGDRVLKDTFLTAYNETSLNGLEEHERMLIKGSGQGAFEIPKATSIAAAASMNAQLVYAITKYELSTYLCSVYNVDLEPYRAPHIPLSFYPMDHTLYSYAIVLAYSAIEDIGLEVRACEKKPSTINGQWNPVVKDDLLSRLSDACIDHSNTLLWTSRGDSRLIEKIRPVPISELAPWAEGEVKDCDVELIDAIAYASWLRSKVASHSTKELTKVLSVYDVINVQHLARRLLLEQMGFWKGA